MKHFKVFYSWQSDLPGNTNRNFLNTCIEEAVKNCNSVVDGIEIIADSDTKGKTGSPNISQTIFEKIDECDLFIADVSIVNSCMITAEDITDDGAIDLDGGSPAGKPADAKDPQFRYTPNPNVLIELGFAVKCLGWERVICFINTDYGEIKKLPFDLDHQRVTGYSFSDPNKDKSKVKKELCGIITDTILELSKTSGTSRKGKAFHVVGTYDSENKTIDVDLVAYDVRNYCWIEEFFEEHRNNAMVLIEKIKSYKLLMRERAESLDAIEDFNQPLDQFKKLQKALGLNSSDNMTDCNIGHFIQESIRELAYEYLSVKADCFDNNFFNLGNLKIQAMVPINPLIGRIEPEKLGSDEEKAKYSKIQELHSILIEMQQLDLYLRTFDDVLLFPLAIENNSDEMDTDLEVVVEVEGSCETITPSVDFINPEIRESAHIIYQAGYPRDLLYLQEDADIKYDDNQYLNYDPEKPFYGQTLAEFYSKIEDKEYGYAMEHYIATPGLSNNYVFRLSGLRAKEKKWLGGIIALRKPDGAEGDLLMVKMKYRIISNNTDGNLEGALEYKG